MFLWLDAASAAGVDTAVPVVVVVKHVELNPRRPDSRQIEQPDTLVVQLELQLHGLLELEVVGLATRKEAGNAARVIVVVEGRAHDVRRRHRKFVPVYTERERLVTLSA